MADSDRKKIITILTICIMLVSVGLSGCVEEDSEDNKRKDIPHDIVWIDYSNLSIKLPENESLKIVLGPFKINTDVVENAKVTFMLPNKHIFNYTDQRGIVELEIDFPIPFGEYLLIVETEGNIVYAQVIEIEIYE
jgi:hypothetical protein